MDLQEILNNAVVASRAKEMLSSPQLTLGELILKLEAIYDKNLPVIFDNKKYHPVGVISWRGSYRELAIEYSSTGKVLSVKKFLKMLKNTVGKSFVGYKGGDFLMGRVTPVWVANYGNAEGFKVDGDGDRQAVIDVSKGKEHIVIKTKVLY